MAKLYRPTYRKCIDGKTVERQTAKWYAKVKLNGKRRAIPLTTDKRASEIMLADLLRRDAMGQAGAVDPFDAPSRVALERHVADWQADLRFRDASDKHVVAVGKLVTRFLDASRSVYPPDATAESVTRFLARHKADGHSPRTVNWTANTLRAFFAWMVREKRMAASPALGIVRLNESTDIRRQRRPLVGDEPERLVAAADGSHRVFRGMAGIDRGTLYVVAMGTGFRVAELASLTMASLDLDAPTPTVRLAAGAAKNGTETVQPLPTFAVNRLRLIETTGRLFPGTWGERAAKMLRYDLDAAGIPATLAGRVVDFHSLRHTFVANLRRSGVELGDAMKLARHSDPKLTLATYGQSDLDELAEAVNRLGRGLGRGFGTEANESERLCATGGDVARLYNAPEDAAILAFSAELQAIPPARFERATCRLEGGSQILQFPAENPELQSAWTRAWTDPQLRALIAAWPSLPAPVRSGILRAITEARAA